MRMVRLNLILLRMRFTLLKDKNYSPGSLMLKKNPDPI